MTIDENKWYRTKDLLPESNKYVEAKYDDKKGELFMMVLQAKSSWFLQSDWASDEVFPKKSDTPDEWRYA